MLATRKCSIIIDEKTHCIALKPVASKSLIVHQAFANISPRGSLKVHGTLRSGDFIDCC